MISHLDQAGQPCTRHAPASADQLLALATLGSRMTSFHHDAASKMQILMMALDELSELVEASQPELRLAVDTAHTSLRELNQLFATNRALAKAPARKRTALGELVPRAAEQSGVNVRGVLPAVDVDVAPASILQALALLLDLVAGAAHLGRVVDVSAVADVNRVTLTIAGPPEAAAKPPANATATLALATFLVQREDGELRCEGERFSIGLPVAMATSAMPKIQP